MVIGPPKGAILTHANLVADISAYRWTMHQVCRYVWCFRYLRTYNAPSIYACMMLQVLRTYDASGMYVRMCRPFTSEQWILQAFLKLLIVICRLPINDVLCIFNLKSFVGTWVTIRNIVFFHLLSPKVVPIILFTQTSRRKSRNSRRLERLITRLLQSRSLYRKRL